jgi:hypothetical protein
LTSFTQTLEEFDQKLKLAREEALKEVSDSITKVVHKLRREISDSYGGQPIDAREFRVKMGLKADCKEIEKLKERVVYTHQFEEMQQRFKQSKSQLTQTLLVLIEYMRNLSEDTKQHGRGQKAASMVFNNLQSVLSTVKRHKIIESAPDSASMIIKNLCNRRNSTALVSKRMKHSNNPLKINISTVIPSKSTKIKTQNFNHEVQSLQNSPSFDKEKVSSKMEPVLDIKFNGFFGRKINDFNLTHRTLQVGRSKRPHKSHRSRDLS